MSYAEFMCFLGKNAVSLLALVVSVLTLGVVFSQMKIASAAVKLDLYNKRFDVYKSALDLYMAIWGDWNYESIRPLELQFIKSFRESQFLFSDRDGIYKILEKIKDCNAAISAYEKYRTDESDEANESNREYGRILHEKSIQARTDFEINLLLLESKIEKYLYFGTITGWQFMSSK